MIPKPTLFLRVYYWQRLQTKNTKDFNCLPKKALLLIIDILKVALLNTCNSNPRFTHVNKISPVKIYVVEQREKKRRDIFLIFLTIFNPVWILHICGHSFFDIRTIAHISSNKIAVQIRKTIYKQWKIYKKLTSLLIMITMYIFVVDISQTL